MCGLEYDLKYEWHDVLHRSDEGGDEGNTGGSTGGDGSNTGGGGGSGSGAPQTIRNTGRFGWDQTTTFNQSQAMEYWESTYYSQSDFELGLIMGVAGWGIDAFLDLNPAYSGMILINNLQQDYAGHKIYEAAKQGSLTVVERMDYTTGSLNITVKDRNGSVVSSITYGSTGWFK